MKSFVVVVVAEGLVLVWWPWGVGLFWRCCVETFLRWDGARIASVGVWLS